MNEDAFLALLRTLPLHPGADELRDDAAVIGDLVLTVDTLVEGVHFLPGDPAADVAWKLVATNLSDLAAKGAVPEGVLLSYPLSGEAWDCAFVDGLGAVLAAHACPLIGGDTVSLPAGAPRILSLTAIGRAARVPRRSGARPGDTLWVTGTIGDAGAGLGIAMGQDGPAGLLAAYRRPRPHLVKGQALAAHVHAMMDVSDGLLIDAGRMAAASGVAITVDLSALPLSADYRAHVGDDTAARMKAATAGDDYVLLFAAPTGWSPPVAATAIGRVQAGNGLSLVEDGEPLPLPARLGWQHG